MLVTSSCKNSKPLGYQYCFKLFVVLSLLLKEFTVKRKEVYQFNCDVCLYRTKILDAPQ